MRSETQFAPDTHANRYYKSLCMCDFPMHSRIRGICAICGGFIPHWRQFEMVEQERMERGGAIVFLFFLFLIFAVIIAIDWVAPQLIDGAINQIGR